MIRTNDDNKTQLCHLVLRVWNAQQAASRLERTEMAVPIVEGKAHQLISLNGVLLFLLYKYRVIPIDQIDFTLFIITSVFKHQCFRLICVNSPRSTATKIILTRERCCTSIAPELLHGYKNTVVRTPDTHIFVILLYHAHAIKQADSIP